MTKNSIKLVVSLLATSMLVLTVGAIVSTETVMPTETVIPASEDINQNVAMTQNIAVIQNVDVNQNVAVNQNVDINQNVTISAPISIEEKNIAINVAINFTVNNIGIDNPKIVDVTRKEQNLRVRVKDDFGEYIVIIISPKGEAKEEIPNVPTFTETKNNFVGRHVSFQFTNSSILNFTLEGKLIFQSINLGFNSTKIRRIGSSLRISDNKNTVIIYDNANGIIAESALGEIEAIYTVSPEINAEEGKRRVDLSNSNIKGSIISSDSANMVALVSGDAISITLNHEKTTFTARILGIMSAKEDDFEGRIVQGIDDKKIGNIVNIDGENSHDIIGFDVDTTINRVAHNTVSLNVNSDVTDGRTVVLRAGKDIFTNLNLRILVDGHEIKQAIDLDDLFKNDKLAYLMVVGQNVEVLVSIPKFSEHEIIVTSEPPTTTVGIDTPTIPTTTIGTVAPTATVGNIKPITTTKAPGFTLGILLVAMTTLYFLFRKNRQ